MHRRAIERWNSSRQEGEEFAVGDVVVVHSRHNEVDTIVLQKDGSFQNRYGIFEHNDLIGKQPGRRWITSSSKAATGAGFVLALRPTPELWTLGLSHRTQIVYTHDIAVILMEMELKPGCVVIESGTGSGSMTVSLARSVFPSGRVITFEAHAQRAKEAAKDFHLLGLSDCLTVVHRDVSVDGFSGVSDSSVDAVFLDLPAVWEAIDEAERTLRPGGVLATFSPCVEQVQRTVEELRKSRFSEIKTCTVALRSWESRRRVGDYGGSESEVSRKRRREEEGIGNPVGERKGVPDKAQYLKRDDFQIVTRPFRETTSHTSFLTFCRRNLDDDSTPKSVLSKQSQDNAQVPASDGAKDSK
mmetsp:Transcript_1717/g.5185  ORF Transcript_1717/g.5185 Transcript_1717/m.5185 type:complete len:357 (-) Transcript_1717:1230-2300(-)